MPPFRRAALLLAALAGACAGPGGQSDSNPALIYSARGFRMPGFAGGTPPPPPPALLLVERGPRLEASFLPVLVRPSAEETRDSKTLTAAVEALRSGGYRRASILLEDYRRHSVGTLKSQCLHGWVLALSGELDVARNMATALVAGEDPAAPGPAYLMGVVLDKQGRPGDAFAWYQLALRAAPSDADLLTRTAATGSAAREPEFVLECLKKLDHGGGLPLELEPLRARALAQVGRGEAALLAYDLLLGQLGEKPEILGEAGLCAFGLGTERNDPSFFDLAADYFNRSVEVDPQNARASYNLGCALDWGGDSSGAELSYFRALEVRPDYLAAAENLSELLVRNDRPGEAREILNEQLRQPLPEVSRSRLLARLASLEETSREEG